MNKILTKVATLALGAAMAVGVGVAVGSKKVSEAKAGYEATTSVAVGDTIVFANDSAKKELSGIGMISTNSCGLATDFTGSVPNAAYPLTVEQGSSSGSFAFKTSDNTYLSWSSGNTLTTASSVSDASSWTVVSVSGKGTMLQNVGTPVRHLSYNSGSPRFCAYGNTNQQGINLYKYVEDSGTKYTVSYNNNGGQGTMDDTVATSPIIAACTFTAPEGKKFGSWNTAANGGGTSYNPGNSASTDLTLYAIWVDIPNYTCAQAISAYDNSGEITNVYVSGYVTSIYTTAEKFSGGKISYYVADTEDGGNQFEFYLGLGIGGTPFTALTDVEVGAFVKGYGSITKYNSTYEFENGNYLISYTAPVATDYSVSFNGNGASGSMSSTSTHGDYTLPVNGFDVPSGKVFAGWKAGNAGDLYAAGATYSVSADVVFYAQWANAYTVSFVAGGGSGTMSSISVPEGTDYQLPKCTFIPPEGKVFDHWEDENGDTVTVIEGIDDDFVAYATWKDAPATTIVSAMFGSDKSTSSTEITDGEKYRTDYQYTIDSDLSFPSVSKVYPQESKAPKFGSSGSVGSMTVKVNVENAVIVSVTVNAYRYHDTKGTTMTIGGIEKELTTEAADYVADVSSAQSDSVVISAVTSSSDKRFYVVSITIEYSTSGVTPVPTTYSVTYDSNGGSGTMTDPNSPYSSGSTVTTLNNEFTKENYHFVSWNTSSDGKGTSYDEGGTFTISANTTLYAMWEENGGGGTSVSARYYKLVESTDDLVDGAKYIIASGSTYSVALSTTQNSNNRGEEGISISENIASVSNSGVQVVTLEATGVEDKPWALKVGESSYLYAASSSSNHLKTQTTLDDNGKWVISFESDSAASIVAQGSNSHNILKYNNTSNLFSCYTGGQKSVYLYRLSFEETLLGNITCDGNGSNTFADGFTWSDLKAVYADLPTIEQNSLKSADNDGLVRYDYLIAKYGEEVFENFIGRTITPLPNAAYIAGYQSSIDSSSSITIIVVVAVASMTLLGVTLVLRKRKHQ